MFVLLQSLCPSRHVVPRRVAVISFARKPQKHVTKQPPSIHPSIHPSIDLDRHGQVALSPAVHLLSWAYRHKLTPSVLLIPQAYTTMVPPLYRVFAKYQYLLGSPTSEQRMTTISDTAVDRVDGKRVCDGGRIREG